MRSPVKASHDQAAGAIDEGGDSLGVGDLRVRRSDVARGRKTMQITVERSGDLILSTPPAVEQDRELRAFVLEKRFWIYKPSWRRRIG